MNCIVKAVPPAGFFFRALQRIMIRQRAAACDAAEDHTPDADSFFRRTVINTVILFKYEKLQWQFIVFDNVIGIDFQIALRVPDRFPAEELCPSEPVQ